MDVGIRSTLTRKKTNRVYKVKWWNLNGENVNKLFEKIKTEGKWRVEGHSNSVWEEMAECIRKSVREALGVYKEGSGRMKGAWWWSEEVKGKVKDKHEKYMALVGSKMDEEREVNRIQYRNSNMEAKKVVAVAMNNTYERLY